MRTVVVQGRLPDYRVPFFQALADRLDSLTVAHSAFPAGPGEDQVSREEWRFEERILPHRSALGIHLQRGLGPAVRSAEALVVMFDLRWPMNIIETLRPGGQGRRLLWGYGLGRRRLLWPARLAWIRAADGVIVYHRNQADQLIDLGVPHRKVFVAPNSVAHPTVAPAATARNSILFVGRLQPRKRVDVLVDAFGLLRSRGDPPDVWLDVVGDGPERHALEALARHLGVADRVRFHGSVFDPARLAELFGRAFAYATPGWTGLGLLHAFGYGVPAVIGEGIPHAPEAQDLVPGVNGLMARPVPEDFAAALARLAEDPELRTRLGRAAREFARSERRIEHMVDGFVEALTGPSS